MRECKNTNIDLESLSEKNEEETKIESFQFPKRKLLVGQWVDVKDTIDQWLEAQVIDIKDNRVYIHYNGWGTRWDEWIDMDSDRIMPFRYYTKQTTFSNYNCPFPNVKPDANVNIYNQNTNDANQQQHQFFDFFNDLSSSFDYCRDIFEKINENRRFIRNNKGNGIRSSLNNLMNDKNDNNFIIGSGNRINFASENVNSDNNIDLDFISFENSHRFNNVDNNNKDNLIIIPDIKEESKIPEDNSNNIINTTTDNTDFERLKRIKQREIFIYSKQLSPLLDRLGRVMTDMGLYMYHNMKNNKLEE